MPNSLSDLHTLHAWEDNQITERCTQGEYAGKVLQFKLVDKDGAINLSNCLVQYAVTRPDKTEDLLDCTVDNGVVKCNLTYSATSISGLVHGEVRVIGSNNSGTIKFYGVNLRVYKGVSDEAAEQSDEFTALVAALQKVVSITPNPDSENTYVVRLDDSIVQNGLNPVASGVIYDYLNGNFYTKANTYTKSEINTKVSSLSNRLALHISVGFNANGVPVKFVDGTTISSGAFTNSDVTKIFISQDVQTISNGAFAGCPALSDIYFDSTSTSYDNSTIPSGVTAHTLNNYHIMNCILDCVKYLDDNKAQSISSGRLPTTADSIHYPSVAAVKDFLYANFYTDDEVDDLLDLVYSKTAADDLFATKSNTYTKSEINAIQTENDKRFELQTTVGFDENGIPVFTSNNTSFSAGSCTVNNIKTLFIASNVRLLQSGAFTTNSTDIEVVFIDNEQSGIAIQSGALPDGATIYYKGQFNALGFVIDAIVAIKPRIMSITIPTSGWSNNEYDITSLMPPSANANTRVDVSIGASVQEQLVADGCGGIYASTDTSNSITTFTLHAMYNKPTANITVQLTLTQLVSV